MLPDPKEVEAVQEALTNLMKVDPNLLFRATIGFHNNMLRQYLEEILTGAGLNERRRSALKLRMLLSFAIGSTLLKSGRIILKEEEKQIIEQFMQSMQDDENKKKPGVEGSYWT